MKTTNRRASFAPARSRISRWLTLGASIAIAGSVASCVPELQTSDRVDDTVIFTSGAPGVDFGLYRTFYLRPEIRELKDDGTEPLPSEVAEPLLEKTKDNLIARGFVEADSKEEADLAVEMIYINTRWVAQSCYAWWDYYYWGYPGYPYYPYYGGCTASTWETQTLATSIADLASARAGGTTRMLALDGSAPLPDSGGNGSGGTSSVDSGSGSGGADVVDAGDSSGGRLSATGGRPSGSGGALADSGTGLTPVIGGIWFSAVYGVVYGGVADSVQKGLEGIDQAFAQSPYVTRK